MKNLKLIALVALCMLLLDGLWLGFIANGFYLENLKHLIRGDGSHFEVNYWAAGLVYVFMALGFLLFLAPYLSQWSYRQTVMKAAAFGIIVYGVYDFTNLATLKDWPLIVALADVAWGAVLYTITALVVKASQIS
jgi:uncharacterized membrane protein